MQLTVQHFVKKQKNISFKILARRQNAERNNQSAQRDSVADLRNLFDDRYPVLEIKHKVCHHILGSEIKCAIYNIQARYMNKFDVAGRCRTAKLMDAKWDLRH